MQETTRVRLKKIPLSFVSPMFIAIAEHKANKCQLIATYYRKWVCLFV